MVGGYGIHSVNSITEQQTYTPIRNVATWLDFSYGKVLVPGLFFGFLKKSWCNRMLGTNNSEYWRQL